MDKALRIEKLNEIAKSPAYTSGIRIPYKGDILKLNAYQIPLEYLIYNKYNGRIASLVKSFEKQSDRILNAENEDDAKILEDFLWESKKDRNKHTMIDLKKNKPNRPTQFPNGRIILYPVDSIQFYSHKIKTIIDQEGHLKVRETFLEHDKSLTIIRDFDKNEQEKSKLLLEVE